MKGVIKIEIWKDIENYEGYYQISNYGRVKNLKTQNILSLSDINNVGYYRITLYTPNKKRFFIHRLVAYHFCEGYKEGLVVNHKDGDKQNNYYENLEWVTRSENDLHAYRNNLRTVSGGAIIQQQKSYRQVVVQTIDTNEIVYIFDNYSKCAEYFGLNKEYVRQCCLGKYKLKRKYNVHYIENELA